MKFIVDYNDIPEQRTLLYHVDEFSFDMDPWSYEIDSEISINTLTLSIIDGKIIQLNGFLGLNKKMKSNYATPQSKSGALKILHPEKYWDGAGSNRVNKEDWPVYINVQTGWVCIGNPEKKGKAVEFINNCIAIIDDNKLFVSLWIKPNKLQAWER